MISSELLQSFSDYMNWKNEKVSHNFPRELIRKMEEYLVNKYGEDLIEIGEFILTALTNPSNENAIKIISEKYKKIKEEIELYNSIVEHNTVIGEYKEMAEKKLAKLIDTLMKNQEGFEKEASKDYSGIFLISYYMIYLDFITKLYLMLADLKLAKPNVRTIDLPYERKIINLINTAVFLFAIPIIIYLEKGKIMGELTYLQGIMLYFITKDRTFVNPNSLGYKLFLAVFND
ncbi:hypothetical protein SJAV_09140 [Sulfurisphaera javensis]|uniref:Uncharacterized protein n=1 Tax=Sulfurisphaera javensis TaxID=2049879 RepID=A0AAT9GQ52_9CREN